MGGIETKVPPVSISRTFFSETGKKGTTEGETINFGSGNLLLLTDGEVLKAET